MTKSILRSHPNFVFAILITLMTGLGCLRVVSTYKIFSQTWDEPFHIAAGMEWLNKGQYTYEPYQPPLARVMSALGLYLDGIRGADHVSTFLQMWEDGNVILQSRGQYERNLSLARLGILPFFIIASFVVAVWAKNYGGIAVSLLSTLLFTTLPSVLAHAGIAALDMACTALVAAALLALTLWLRRPTLFHSFLLGITIGLAILSKFPALFFLLVSGGLIVALYALKSLREKLGVKGLPPKNKQWIIGSAVFLLICALTIWSGYRFSARPLVKPENRPYERIDRIVGTEGIFHDISYFILEKTPIPAPEFIQGIQDFFSRNNTGHLAYFFGDIRRDGWWYYFPVIFLVKTPLPFVLLSLIGFFFILRNIIRKNPEWFQLSIPAIASICILAIGMVGGVDNGLRQILSIYPLLAIVAGYGAINLMHLHKKSQFVGLGLITLLFSWHLISSIGAHPDYLAYFNELAWNHPEKIAVDSDLDWGQDLNRLASTLENRKIPEITVMYNGSSGIDLDLFNLPPIKTLEPYQKTTGWIAISIYKLKLGTGEAPYDQFAWLRSIQPVEHVGKSIWLYYIPEK